MARHGLFTKEQLAQPYGLAAASIDLYVARDILHPIQLRDGVFFTSSDLLRIEIIQKGKRLGLSLEEIRLLIESARTCDQPPPSVSE